MIAFLGGGAGSPSLIVTYEQLDASERISDRIKRQIDLVRRANPQTRVSPVTHRCVPERM
jgi:hypothetical protein